MKFDENLQADFKAGFTVALVALPLSIGIALASGAPASAGIIAAIIGGILGSWSGGSYVTISGPAAGLIVIVLDAIVQFGHGDPMRGFKCMLAASVVAGAIQIIFGLLKMARKGSAFPVSVIHGMMAAIGLIIIAKQVHSLFGYTPVAKNPVMLFMEIPYAVINLQPGIFTIGIVSLALVVSWPKLPWAWTKLIPGPLLGVIVGTTMAVYMGLPDQSLLAIPADFSKWIVFPDFSVMSTFAGWKAAITLALVASLETVLSAAAVDKLDPQKRKTDLDKDLISKGLCNTLGACIGGLPMIAEIVRSSANVSYGAKTWKANFFHSAFILIAVVALPSVLGLIPYASLAAILVMVGSRLGNPTHFLHAKKVGLDNLTGFAVTLFTTVAVDLLVGIFAGAMAQFAVEMFLGLKWKHLLRPHFLSQNIDQQSATYTVDSALTFSNFLGLKDEILKRSDEGKNVELILSECEYIDHSVMEQIDELKSHFRMKNLFFNVMLSEKHRALGQDHLSAQKKAS